jgi:hypothetical protein
LPRASAAGIPGLSKSHNGPFGTITLYRGASLAKVATRGGFSHNAAEEVVAEGQQPKRGDITEFSARSRQRLRCKIASICRKELPYFLTLTYPAEWIWDADLWKRHLKIFSQRFIRRFPTAGFVWKLEFQRRGAPHFHPFVWGIPETEGWREIIDFVSEAWFEVVGSGDQKHFIAGTRVEKLRSATAAIRYVSGYASKSDQTLVGKKVGRYWGVVAKENIPWGLAETIELNERQSKMVLRTCRRFIMAVNRQQRIKRVAKQIRWNASELVSFGGWFEGRKTKWGKHLRAVGRRMPQKLRLRNIHSMNVFLDADYWASRLDTLKLLAAK